jgi:hypothetical protein
MSAPCRKCGTQCDRTSLVFRGIEVGSGYLCETCLDAAHAEMAVAREQFEALLAAGISREEANRIMIARHDGTEIKA